MSATQLVQDLNTRDVYYIVDKFLHTEQEYVDTLYKLNHIEKRLRVHFDLEDYILDPDEIDAIFLSSGSIYNFTKDLLKRLTAKRWDGPDQFLAAIGEMLAKDIHFFRMYGQYILDIKDAEGKLRHFKEKNSKFRTFLALNEKVFDVEPDRFVELVQAPKHHLPIYVVFLQSMVNAVGNHDGADALKDALSKMLGVMNDISYKAETAMRINKVVEIQKNIFKDSILLVEASRKYYRSSPMKIKDPKEHKKPEDCTLYLFNDILIYSTTGLFGGINFKGFMPIAGLHIIPLLSIPNAFRLVSDVTGREWELQCVPDEPRKKNNKNDAAQQVGDNGEKSYGLWLSALLKVYNMYYNIAQAGQQAHATSMSATILNHEDQLNIIRGKTVAAPRTIPKPSPIHHEAAQSLLDTLLQRKPQGQNQAAAVQAGNTQAPRPPQSQTAAAAAPMPPSTPSPVPPTPSAAVAVPPVQHTPLPEVIPLTYDEVCASFGNDTTVDTWVKLYDDSNNLYYYANSSDGSTQWDEPQAFTALYQKTYAENQAAYEAYQASLRPPPTPAPQPSSPMPPMPPTPGQPPMPPATPATAGGPPSLPSMPPATPGGQPPMPPTPATAAAAAPTPGPARPAFLAQIGGGGIPKLAKVQTPPETPTSKSSGPGLMGAIQGGVQLRKVDPAAQPAASAPAQEQEGGLSNLAKSLQRYRAFVQAEESDDDDDDDDW